MNHSLFWTLASMASNLIVSLVLFTTLLSSGVLCDGNPWREFKEFNDELLVGPPRIQQFIYDLSPEFKDGKTVVFNNTVASQDYEGCVVFDYYVRVLPFGKFGLHLGIFDPETNKYKTLWSRYGYNGDIWKVATLKFNIKKGQFLQFRASATDAPETAAISFSPLRYDVSLTKCSMYDHNNDFEGDYNRWEGESMETAKFFSNVVDHTSGSAEGKVGIVRYNTRITPKKLPKKDAKCFSFWYMQMNNGTNDATFDFHAAYSGGILWKSRDNYRHEKQWVQVQIPLNSRFKENYITIQADIMDKDPGTFVAIDDIEFSVNPCPEEPISCDFSTSTCGWISGNFNSVLGKADNEWYLGKGRPISKAYVYDHLQTPVHKQPALYVDFTKYVPQGAPVRITTPKWNIREQYCAEFNFMYNRFQKADSFAFIQTFDGHTFEHSEPLWELEKSENIQRSMNEYVEETARVQIDFSAFPRRFAFAAKSSYPTFRVAIKDIKLTKGLCSIVTPAPTLSPFEKSRLPKDTLIVAHELMKNSLANVEQILKQIKGDDPVKVMCDKIVTELTSAIAQIEFNLKQ